MSCYSFHIFFLFTWLLYIYHSYMRSERDLLFGENWNSWQSLGMILVRTIHLPFWFIDLILFLTHANCQRFIFTNKTTYVLLSLQLPTNLMFKLKQTNKKCHSIISCYCTESFMLMKKNRNKGELIKYILWGYTSRFKILIRNFI